MSAKRSKAKQVWFEEDDPVPASVIRDVGRDLGVVFPEAFVEIASKYNGGCPDRDIFDVPGRPECVFDYLISFPEGIQEFIREAGDRLPASLIPFATDPFGNAICFDYRGGTDGPSVAFWDHESCSDARNCTSQIAGTFEEFCDSLYSI